ncbi:LLM class flavin-dependent oxidoreductase, partial [Streptomyces sp. NPDC001193]
MLPNHPPLVVAEQFGMLQSLASGRVGLGLGRAPGTDRQAHGHLAHDQPQAEFLPPSQASRETQATPPPPLSLEHRHGQHCTGAEALGGPRDGHGAQQGGDAGDAED